MRSAVLDLLASIYRYAISPALHALAGPGGGCRFHPSCGEYARQAITRHGWIRGGALACRRLLRCHPWGFGGEDPVPVTESCGRKKI